MGFLKRNTSQVEAPHGEKQNAADTGKLTFRAVFLGIVVSMGGFIFGYVSGQVSGYFNMTDYGERFGQKSGDSYEFSATRQGTITALLCIGCMIGALSAGNLADTLGRRMSVCVFAFWSMIGTVIEISSEHAWFQPAIGRLVTGVSVGGLSVVVPMYQSESAPAIIRGVLVATYQLFVTLGIWTSYMVDWGTHDRLNSASWRIPVGISFAWALILGVGVLFLPESPRYAFVRGREEEARNTIASLAGLPPDCKYVNEMMDDIRSKHEADIAAGKAKLIEVFTGPRMFYRTMLGIVLQAGQQLTGANFFFYYGTTVFQSTGISDSYVIQIIIGTVNVVCTFGGLVVIQKVGRRKSLIAGAAWMVMCFFIYAFVGSFALDRDHPENTPQAGAALIVFSCLAIAAFAVTWGPIVWAAVAEMYPLRYRAPCMALATASNWLWNFLISFFTRFITDSIHYWYGMVFAGCCIGLIIIVFFFLIESKDRSLEEIDTMYLLHVNPITSASWDGSKVPDAVKGDVENPEGGVLESDESK